jgi:hypothetical protein
MTVFERLQHTKVHRAGVRVYLNKLQGSACKLYYYPAFAQILAVDFSSNGPEITGAAGA